MAGEPGHPQKCAGDRAIHQRPLPRPGAQQIEEDERHPHRAVHHLRPIRAPNISREREDRSRATIDAVGRPPQLAAQPVAERRRHEMDSDEIPREHNGSDVPRGSSGIQNISQLSGYAAPGCACPSSGWPLQRYGPTAENRGGATAGLRLEPGQHLAGEVGRPHPVVLFGKRDPPIKQRDNRQQQRRNFKSAKHWVPFCHGLLRS